MNTMNIKYAKCFSSPKHLISPKKKDLIFLEFGSKQVHTNQRYYLIKEWSFFSKIRISYNNFFNEFFL
jgi:hypothetical protein